MGFYVSAVILSFTGKAFLGNIVLVERMKCSLSRLTVK